jgi:O-antigen/teichoic acid export membrane protein
MITGILRPAQNQAANLLNSMGKSRITFWANTATLSMALVINYICLRRYGFYGAAIGTVIATSLGFIAWYFIMRKQIGLELSCVWNYTLDTYRNLFRRVRGFVRKAPTS